MNQPHSDHGHSHSSSAHAAHAHHHHGASHHHHAPPTNFSRAFAVAICLNLSFVVIEFAYGVIAHSTALLADAGHNLSDVMGLLLAWGATLLARRQPAGRYTYGLRSTSILAALGNAGLLMATCAVIGWEALQRLVNTAPVAGLTVSTIAAVGIVVNGLSALLFVAGSKNDLNIRGAFLHLATDALVSLGVVISGIVVFYSGWNWLDPALSLAIIVIILIGTWGLLRDAIRLSLSAVPAAIDLQSVHDFLLQQPNVSDVCDLHIWGMSTTENALTAHLIMPAGHPGDQVMSTLSQELEQRFMIHHSTLQILQQPTARGCQLLKAY